jgi:FAD-dependent oxidoreductase domain-containing protein 1
MATQAKTETLTTDYLIIGAGLIGSAVAMGLSRLGIDRVMVVDLDLAGEWSSSELNAGGVRATWAQPVNLLTSKFSIEYYMKHAEEVGYRGCGYLWLHKPETFRQALETREMHVKNGWPVEVLDRAGIAAKVPFIDKLDDLAGALYGVNDGLINPNRLKEHFRELAKPHTQFLDGVWITGSSMDSGTVNAFQFSADLTSEEKRNYLTLNPTDASKLGSSAGHRLEIKAQHVVNCAGAWAPHIAQILGYTCAAEPVRRQISLFHTRDLDLTPFGMIVDPSGVYFHPEAVYGLAGFATPGEAPGYNFEYDGEQFFEEHIWPVLAERATAFESLKHVSGWSGLYENSPDHHAIVGEVPSISVNQPKSLAAGIGSHIFEAHSFSGHGAMHSYGVGIALAERMALGKYQTLDLSPLSASRFHDGLFSGLSQETWVI